MARLGAAPGDSLLARRRRGPARWWSARAWMSLAVVVIAALLLYPVIALLRESVSLDQGSGTLSHWRAVLSQQGTLTSVRNTVVITALIEVVALPASVVLTWLITRTNLAGRRWFDMALWLAFFMPTLPVVMGWVLILDPQFGLLNEWSDGMLGVRPFNIYSVPGLVFLHITTKSIAGKYVIMSPAFQNMDGAMEEASRMSGAGAVTTMRRVIVPLLRPTVVATGALSVIYTIESVEIIQFVGTRFDFGTYSTEIYQLTRREPPLYGQASVLGMMMLTSLVPLVILQLRYSRSSRFGLVSGRSNTRPMHLGAGRWPLSAAVLLLMVGITVIPLAMLIAGSSMRLFGFFDIPDPWTNDHWARVLDDPLLERALLNTLKIGLGAAVLGAMVYTFLAYVALRGGRVLGPFVDGLAWIPLATPGMILGLGLLAMFLETPFLRPLYGSFWSLVVALVIAGTTLGVQAVRNTLIQLNIQMEESSALSGATPLQTLRWITLPLIAPAVMTSAALTFGIATANVAHIALLGGAQNQPLSLLQLQYMFGGEYEAAAVVGVLIVAISFTAVALSKAIATRLRGVM